MCKAIIFHLSGVIGLLLAAGNTVQNNQRDNEHREISGWNVLVVIQELKVKRISKHLVVNACPEPANLQI